MNYCEYHAGYHAGHSAAFMRNKRKDRHYRQAESEGVKLRMRKLRADPSYVRPEKRAT